MTEKTPSERISSLVDGQFKPPFIWNALTNINQSVISLECQNEDLIEANASLAEQINMSNDLETIRMWEFLGTAGDPPPFVQSAFDREGARLLTQDSDHYKDCETWYGGECDCAMRLVGMEKSYD